MNRRHDRNDIQLLGDEFVLTCECGWKTEPARDAAVVGAEWDEHRRLGAS